MSRDVRQAKCGKPRMGPLAWYQARGKWNTDGFCGFKSRNNTYFSGKVIARENLPNDPVPYFLKFWTMRALMGKSTGGDGEGVVFADICLLSSVKNTNLHYFLKLSCLLIVELYELVTCLGCPLLVRHGRPARMSPTLQAASVLRGALWSPVLWWSPVYLFLLLLLSFQCHIWESTIYIEVVKLCTWSSTAKSHTWEVSSRSSMVFTVKLLFVYSIK